MRKILMMMTLAAVLLPASMNADAGGRGYGHHGHGHSHARVGVGFYFGAPLLYAPYYARPYYYPSYHYSAPPVVVRERIVVREPLVFYDENGNPVPPTAPVQVQAQAPAAPPTQSQPQAGAPAPAWYFCADSQKYYPYVQTCASPWQRVVPQSPPQ